MLKHVYGSDALKHRRFGDGKENVKDDGRSGRYLQTSRTAENIEKFFEVVRNIRLQTRGVATVVSPVSTMRGP
ncbi:hypothetical protein TNCV_4701001 [Trichonephila clavipes]|nr:hypothetical protein TNCV_4701001 [Trichonephila clavipes]